MASIINTNSGGNNPDSTPAPKQIRFVNNQGQPPTKRRRINAACLTCRRRKTRCSGEQPSCLTCTKNGHVCLGYTDPPDPKKEPAVGLGIKSETVASSSTNSNIDQEYVIIGEDAFPDTSTIKTEDSEYDAKRAQNRGGNSTTNSQSTSTTAKTDRTTAVKPERLDSDTRSSGTTEAQVQQVANLPSNSQDVLRTTDNAPMLAEEASSVVSQLESYRVPYFRYFGPTAIVPGFKQMVVKVRDRRQSSMSVASPSSSSAHTGLLSSSDHETAHLEEAPVYDPNDPAPVHPLIMGLLDTFFTHLGSNYPFLRRNKFPAMVREKRAEPILVDAVCALAARFSDDVSLFKRLSEGKARPEYGQVYARRARAAVVETFPCPSVAAVQACLLMAYDGFGADQDSALWMYLGVAIRMAVDLGLMKEDGVRVQGHMGNTAHRAKPSVEVEPIPDQKEVEQERIDTLWAVFFLDRVISSGTGRPVTLRDDDLELELPTSSIDHESGSPDPLPELLQIIHLYGRVTDVLNNVNYRSSAEKLQNLIELESEVTHLFNDMNAILQFNPSNFKNYVSKGQGQTFLLLHVWFHALVIVLHQPKLLSGSDNTGSIHQLRPQSREISMSSAKSIADILAFAELLDLKTITGNPFTSQPIYIAANAFLMESSTALSAAESLQPAGTTSTSPTAHNTKQPSTRHSLLASAANQNYQACYKALKRTQKYWGGVRYILTALDQKSEGIWDVETYTMEEYNDGGKRRRQSTTPRFMGATATGTAKVGQVGTSEKGPPVGWSLTGATNSPNSSLTLLYQGNPAAFSGHPSHQTVTHQPQPTQAIALTNQASPGSMIYDPIRSNNPPPPVPPLFPPGPSSPYPQPNTSALRHSVDRSASRSLSISSLAAAQSGKPFIRQDTLPPEDPGRTPPTPSDTKLPSAVGGSSSQVFTSPSQHSASFEYRHASSPTGGSGHIAQLQQQQPSATPLHQVGGGGYPYFSQTAPPSSTMTGGPPELHLLTYDNETDIGQHLASFEHAEMMSWLGDYYPNDVLGGVLYPGPGGESNMG